MANTSNDGAENTPESSRDSGLEKSFVGKVVSGLINSTPLSKWFAREPKSSVRKRDEEEDDEDFDSTYTFQPPTKRAKLPAEPQRNNYTGHVFESPVTVHNASNNVNKVGKFPEPVPGTSGVMSRKLFEKHNTATTNTLSLNSYEARDAVNGDDTDSEESTSGYSSAARLVGKPDSDGATKTNETHDKLTPKSRSLFASSHETTFGRTLFSDRSPQLNTSLSSRRPTFNASTFGSPNFLDRTLSTERALNSPFYNGNTIYGGASAYGRKFGRVPNESRVAVQVKPVNKKPANETATLSKTARKILNALEHFNTPITEAKKIPVASRRQGLLTQYVGATPYVVRDKKKASNRELQVPSVPDLLQMKQKERLQNSTESVRQIATQSKSTLKEKEEYSLPVEKDDKQKHSNKMKSSIASARTKVQADEAPVSAVNLPKVSLPITTLPKFDFVMMPPSTTSEKKADTSRPATVIKSPKPAHPTEKIETDKKVVENGKTHYTFSNPLVILNDIKSLTAINCFKFSEPLCTKQGSEKELNFKQGPTLNIVKPKNNGDALMVNVAPKQATNQFVNVFKTKEVKATESWECQTCLYVNDTGEMKCVACDEPKDDVEAKKTKQEGFGEQFKLSADKWECGSCLVRNNSADKTCVACASAKPVVQSGFGDKFKPPASTWECTSCLIRNGDNLNKCQACGVDKAQKKTAATFDFGCKFKPPSDTWECDTCMIRNKNDACKCVACEAPKPGARVLAPFKTTSMFKNELTARESPKNSFGEGFKMKKGEWECASCLVKNKSESAACVCCGALKPGSARVVQIDTKKDDGKPLNSFNFGIAKSGTFQFGIPATSSETTPAAVSTQSSFTFGVAKPAAEATPSSFSFGINNTQEKTTPSQTVAPSASNPLLKPNEKLPDKAQPAAAGFKFGLTSAVKTTASNETIGGSKSETTTVAVPTIPMFQFKPPAVNGDVNKQPSKPKEVTFGAETNKTNSPRFGEDVGKTRKRELVVEAPADAAKKPNNSPFGSTDFKPKDALPEPSKPQTSEAPKPQAAPFDVANTNKRKEGAAFAPQPGNMFSFSSASTPTFNFSAKPAAANANSSPFTPAAGGAPGAAFKFGGSGAAPSKQFGDVTGSNGFGDPPKFSSFGAPQGFGTSEPAQGFAFTASEPPKSSGFSFAAAEKPSAAQAAPLFNFGSAAAASAPKSAGFSFSTPSAGFNFGSAAKPDNPAFAPMSSTALAAKNGSFNFGTNANNNNNKAVFSFGGNQTNQPNQASFPPQNQAAFNFGAAAPMSTPQTGGFNFSGPPPSFDASPATGQPQRKIKKALRRTHR